MGLCLFVAALLIFLSFNIAISSNRYLNRFIQNNSRYTTSYFKKIENDSSALIARFANSQNSQDALVAGDQEKLDALFEERISVLDFSDIRMLVKDENQQSYFYQKAALPEELIHASQKENLGSQGYAWIGEKLWYSCSQNSDAYSFLMAIPIEEANLQLLSSHFEGNLLEDIEIGRENININRDSFHWKRLIFSVKIDDEVGAYLTYYLEMDTLIEYFYLGYMVISIAIFLMLAWMLFFKTKQMVFQMHGQIVQFEEELDPFSKGNYSSRVGPSGFSEFDRIGAAVNLLADTIEERNRELADHVQELYGLLVQVMEQKDPYTRGHAERVAEYARGIALELRVINAEEIHSAGLLHDVGKIAISEELLNKPGKFSENEYERMKEHARNGYDLLMESKEFHRIRNWVLYHHERLDGSGYPDGLKGQEIPYEAKVIAVADVFDAMTSDRSYRSAMTAEEALAYLNTYKGIYFQTEIVEALEIVIKASS